MAPPVLSWFFKSWNSVKTFKELPRTMPVLMFSGQQDVVIPPRNMQLLWDALTGKDCKWKNYEESTRQIYRYAYASDGQRRFYQLRGDHSEYRLLVE